MATNLFEAPEVQMELEERPVEWDLAGNGRRFLNFLIDYVCFLVMSWMVGLAIALSGSEALVAWLLSIPEALLGLALMFGYYVGFEYLMGRTPGKLITGTKVVNAIREKPRFMQVVGRTLARFIPFEPFSFLAERFWHDSLSGTYVIRTRIPD